MAVTRSSAAERTQASHSGRRAFAWSALARRRDEALWMLGASLLLLFGYFLVYRAKTRSFAEIETSLANKQLLDLNDLNAREDLLPYLGLFPVPAERQFVARRIYDASGSLRNVGAIARLRVSPAETEAARGLKSFRGRTLLLTAEQFRALKPSFVVRRPAQFRRASLIWIAIFFAAFWAVHLWWSVRAFPGDGTLLPAVLLLTGIGLNLMISLRDPVRDSLLFLDFAEGVAAGCVVLALASALDYERLLGRLSFVPLLASFALSALLIVFGYGPGTSDAKVNLAGFQPIEIVRILLILFLAGYFAQRWDVLRHAREQRPRLALFNRLGGIPPLEYTIPIFACVALSLLFFFLQKDMGPAMVFTCLFLALYAIARKDTLVAAAGLLFLLVGFVGGYLVRVPHTVYERVSMWASPWNNVIHGGDQLAQSLWAYSTGGVWGTGPGLGDPSFVPAAHTDLVLSALGEEWGFIGVLAVFALYAFVLYRSARIALRARSDYEFFLAAGLGVAMVLQILLIAGGSLGVLPLSGVVTPFLSYGRSSMLANFFVMAMLLSISSRPAADPQRNAPFRVPIEAAGLALGALALIIAGKAAYVQVLRSAAIMGEGTLVVQADGARRYQYNPRFQEIMRDIPKGSIYDRNGLPLATSNWDELEKHRAQYQQLGINIDQACSRTESRHYPFEGLTFPLLGDLRTRIRWGASDTSFVERDSATRLRGYDDRPTLVDVANPKTGKTERVVRYDLRELVPLLRHRYEPDNPAVQRVLGRKRDVRMSIDARLEVRAGGILKNALRQAGQNKGALVALDPATGDLLAAVSYPLPPIGPGDTQPDETGEDVANPYLDRVRYGLYPPGSTFKVVTAMAALRHDPQLAKQTYSCIRLPDGRVGNYIHGSNRPIRDDIEDKAPHGTIDMERAVIVSCNAYFAQLGTYNVGAPQLFDTGRLLGISMAAPDTAQQLRKSLPQSSYGQGQVVASPFQMARVAAAIANGGMMPQGRWIADESNDRTDAPQAVIGPDVAVTLGRFMREVVTQGTGVRAANAPVPIAGKTGTAELADAPSHAWFIGFAPYPAGQRIAFAVLIENGQYGGTYAAPAAAALVTAAQSLGLVGGAGRQP
ncbi:MAG TPA: FtsW/RodA/SpoVE family cell cycle protein [Bryobacteraceae bacterium]|jgi:cell division protein FtsW (lipid II flippase)|nr:FtsW/RodA/SpoVE family cell cycle protein [Bryobacteraceae bacterium]